MAITPPSTMLGGLASSLGASEPALRLLISILIGYPLALFHRYTLHGKWPTVQHVFFTTSGLAIGYFNYGNDIVHSIVCVVSLYLLLRLIGGTSWSVGIAFVSYMTYLLVGYYYTGTESYDITWSMPHCVLTLRLIGLAFDVYDGQQNPASLSDDQKKTVLSKMPSLLEISGQTYFYGGFMVGPQFSMRRYQDLVRGAFAEKRTGDLPACVTAGFVRCGTGIAYLLMFQVAAIFLPDMYILSDSYKALPLYQRFLLLGLWGKVVLYKYIACWLLAEGACILTGLTYNGQDENGNILWDGCANVNLSKFETCTTFGEIIQSFNINTNRWVARYVFKRVKFLGNKLASQLVALMFLAVWHGLHSGYYVCFTLEFMVMKFERDISLIVERIPVLRKTFGSAAVRLVLWVVLKVYVIVFMGYCLLAFVALSYPKWLEAYSVTYYSGHLLYGGWCLMSPMIFLMLAPLLTTKGKKE